MQLLALLLLMAHTLLTVRQVISEAGIAFDEAHVPLLVRAAYGEWPVKLVVLLRNPIDRLWSAYNEYGHYKSKYGATPEVTFKSACCHELGHV